MFRQDCFDKSQGTYDIMGLFLFCYSRSNTVAIVQTIFWVPSFNLIEKMKQGGDFEGLL